VTDVEDEDEAREVIEGALRDFGSNVSDNTDGSGVHVLRLDDDDYQELVDALGLDDEANEDEVVEALVNTMNVLRQLPSASAD